jgi:hypothetical protein
LPTTGIQPRLLYTPDQPPPPRPLRPAEPPRVKTKQIISIDRLTERLRNAKTDSVG